MDSDETVELGIDDLLEAVEVGAGGFGTVYKARQESLRRDVAVKMVANTVKDRKVRIRFEREIQAMGMLSGHPNIVTVYDSGFTTSGQPYILMDYMEQGSLADRLGAEGQLPYPDVLAIMVKVAGALETAHQAGILHRDLKPENVLVSAYGEPKLGDFGIARLKGGPETGTASLTASIEHVAPELLEASKPDAASDLYALGSTMYKLLTGEAAFVRKTDESIVPALTRIRGEPVPNLRERGIPPAVAELVERAMAKDPKARYASSAEFGRAIRGVQRKLGLQQTVLPVRADDAKAARDATRTINSTELSASIEDIRGLQGPASATGGYPPPGQPAPPPPGAPVGAPPPPQPGPPAPAYQPPPAQPVPQQPRSQPQGLHGGHQGGAGQRPAPPPAKSSSSGKILAGVGAVVLLGGIGAFLALSGGDDEPVPVPPPTEEVVSETPTTPPTTEEPVAPPEPPPPPPPPAEYNGFGAVTDASERIVVEIPREWNDVDRSPWEIGGQQVGEQIRAAPDLAAFDSSWQVPGVIFGVSEQLRANFDPPSLLDEFSFTSQCTYEGRQDYIDPFYAGVRDDYVDCGNTGAKYTLIAAIPRETNDEGQQITGQPDAILLVQVQRVEDRDDAALQSILNTFFIPTPDDAEG